MKRLPIVVSLLVLIVLSASIAYWGLQLFKFEQRPMQAVAAAPEPLPAPDAAASLFGGQASTVVASNYQLTGVVAAGRESVAILVADGQPPKALKVGREIASGVTVSEVHARYVMLSEGGVLKRIDLATDAKAGPDMLPPQGQPGAMQGQQMRNLPPQQPQQDQQQGAPPPQQTPEPQPGLPPGPPPPPQEVQMPAPTRTVSPGGQAPTQ